MVVNTVLFAILETHTTEEVRNQDCFDSIHTNGADTSDNAMPSTRTAQPLLNPNYDNNSEPKIIRNMNDIYNEIEEIQLDEELYFMGVEEPTKYPEAVKDKTWRLAMEKEIKSIKGNNTWKLTRLPPR